MQSNNFKRGVVFCTYRSLISAARSSSAAKGKGKRAASVACMATADARAPHCTRLEQLMSWCGKPENFHGCVIFDEAHKVLHAP